MARGGAGRRQAPAQPPVPKEKPFYQRMEFSLDGIRFKRTTKLHQEGRYEVTDAEGGKWIVTGDGTNRYPWIVHNERGAVEKFCRNLQDAAGAIARARARNPRSPYKPEPT